MKTVAILGTGLIGTSVGLALERRQPNTRRIGWDPRRRQALGARRRGALDAVAADAGSAIAAADVIVLAAPIKAIERLVPFALERAKTGALVIDVAGLKRTIVRIAARALARGSRALARGSAAFVAGHPLAGSERAGPGAADANLFAGRPFALYAPPQAGRTRAWRRAEAFVRSLGGTPIRVAPAEHDRAVAATSALPQLTAIALAQAVAEQAGKGLRLHGPGLEGATRLAASPFSVWDASLFENRTNAARALRALERRVAALASALVRGDRRKMSHNFRSAAAARRRILPAPSRRNAPRGAQRA